MNIGSHGNHSNSKTGDRVDVEDNDDEAEDDDAVNGGDEEEQKNFEVFSPFCSQPRQTRPLFHTDSAFSLNSVIPVFCLSYIFPFFCDVSLKNAKVP